MKKILVMLVLMMGFVSCDMIGDFYIGSNASGHTLYYSESFEDYNSISDIYKYLRANISYRKDDVENFADPKVVIDRGYGDCEDYCILFMNIAYYSLGIKADLAMIDANQNSRSIVDGGKVNHAVVYYDGVYYDPTGFGVLTGNPSIGFIYTFDEVFE